MSANPIHPLHPRHDPSRRCLTPAEWPEEDRAAWMAATAPADILDDGGRGSNWSPCMRRGVSHAYGRWLNWEAITHPRYKAVPVAQRVTRAWIAAYIADLEATIAPVTVATYLRDLYHALDVMAPEGQWGWLKDVAQRLQRKAIPRRDKRQRIIPSADLFRLGLTLMAQAEAAVESSPLDKAVLFRDGLLIALLAARPLRLSNLVSIEIGRHLVGTRDALWLVFPAAETKQRQPLELSFPPALAPMLDRYLTVHRPALLAPTKAQARLGVATASRALWISRKRAPWSGAAVYGCVVRHTRAAFGFPINPHLARDCAATSVVIEDPEHAAMITSILGHTSLVTAERHYIQASSITAMRSFHGHIKGLREQAARDHAASSGSLPRKRPR